MRAKMKMTIKKALIWVAITGPAAAIIADRLAHAFGICLGAH